MARRVAKVQPTYVTRLHESERSRCLVIMRAIRNSAPHLAGLIVDSDTINDASYRITIECATGSMNVTRLFDKLKEFTSIQDVVDELVQRLNWAILMICGLARQ